MRTIWTNKTFWRRLMVVGLIAWNATIGLASLLIPAFVWDQDRSRYVFEAGPATLAAVIGSIAIIAICLSIPWLAKSVDRTT